MTTYALDTNAIISIINEIGGVKRRFLEAYVDGEIFIVPKIADFEMRRGFKCFKSPECEAAYEELLNVLSVGEVTDDVWNRAADVYAYLHKIKMHKIIGDADIIIGAFCVCKGHTLVTNNTKHFKFINGLAVEDWTKAQKE